MTGRLEGRCALVTGAGNGIGKACALALAAHGASVVVNDLGTSEFGVGQSASAADETVAEIRAAGGTAIAEYSSVATSNGCNNAVAAAVSAFGQLDIVVGVAGALLEGSINATDEEYQRFIDLFFSQSSGWRERRCRPWPNVGGAASSPPPPTVPLACSASRSLRARWVGSSR